LSYNYATKISLGALLDDDLLMPASPLSGGHFFIPYNSRRIAMPNPIKYAPVVQKARMSFEVYDGRELKPHYPVPESRLAAFKLPSIINGQRVHRDGSSSGSN